MNNKNHMPLEEADAKASRRRRSARVGVALIAAVTLVAACSAPVNNKNGSEPAVPYAVDAPTLLNQDDATGAAAFEYFFADNDDIDSVVVSSEDLADQKAAARKAVDDSLPMVIAPDNAEEELVSALKDNGVEKLTTFGTDFQPEGFDVKASEDAATAEQSAGAGDESTLADLREIAGAEADEISGAPVVLAAEGTTIAQVANARAAGAKVLVLEAPDPRATKESMDAVQEGNVIALGTGFSDQEDFDTQVAMASNGEIAGGGGLVFPGRRMIALYGHPSGPALGVMGEQPPAEAVERVKKLVGEYQEVSDTKVIPAFEIIVTIASGGPGPSGEYTSLTDPEDVIPYVDAITEAGGYAFLDLQPGRARLVDQAKQYEELLKRPNVGLALDPEWKLKEGQKHMEQIGSVEASEVNEVADWLAGLVRENNLPQKGLIIHQFQTQMIRDREAINTDRPELSFILHADGHGTPDLKMQTWDALRQGLNDDWFMAWKNFIDEDTPTFTPEETYAIDPKPWFVSYQ